MTSRWFLASAATSVLCVVRLTVAFGTPTRDVPTALSPAPAGPPLRSASPSLSLSSTTRGAYPCNPPARALAADRLGVDSDDLFPGERYPTTGTCVFWSRVDPGEFGIVQIDGLDSDPPSWPCGPDQATEQQRVNLNGTPALVRACTTP